MQPILESLALYLIRTSGTNLGDIRIILPNRRAGLFLQRHLARHHKHVQWSPRIYAINDFINEISLLNICDPVEVLFTLHDIYQECVENPDPFDEFYYWGEMMLKDFDELDKYMVDAEMLFSNIIDLKTLEEPLAGLETEQIKFIRQFWEGFHEGDITPEKDQFLEVWKRLPLLYKKLRKELESRGEGYQGMQYREIVERIGNGGIKHLEGSRTIIAGFNALNGCEKQIFTWLKKLGAEFFWDYDHKYTDDEFSEAGRFMRENIKQFPQQNEIEAFRGLDKEKQIRIFELPTDVLQAKTVHRILEQEGPVIERACTETALVLCDEERLMPVMMSRPENVDAINVTMGYPMKNTPAYSFVDSLLRMQHNIRQSSKGTVQFYHKDVTSIILHPYMRTLDDAWGQTLLDEMNRSNLINVELQFFTGALEQKIFRQLEGPATLLEYLREIFLHLLENLSGKEDKIHQELDREFIFQLLIHLNKLETIIVSRPSITTAILERLLRKMLLVLRVPFEGEPLSGLQVMGILETRLLDFKHIILLSMNEEVMPASHSGQSYIPDALRVAFQMPAREDMDAIYAYYFNRLLQRAEKIDLLYNSGSEGVRTGEMSRYLYQVIYERGTEVIRPGMEVMARETPPLVIPHTPDIDRNLEKYMVNGEEEKYLSPSAINTYIDCSLKFYLRYLAGIGEPNEVREDIDAAAFGTVVHESIRILYSEIADHKQGIITGEELQEVSTSDRPAIVLKEVFIKTHFKGRKRATIEGRNIIVLRVMLKYLEKIIQTDLLAAPITLISVEDTYGRKMKIQAGDRMVEVRLGGKIDRVDRVGDTLRVIDYKTGDAHTRFSTLESLFDSSLGSRNGAAFQTLFYAWLVAGHHSDELIMPGLYVMKALYGEKFDPALSMGSYSQRIRIESFAEVEVDYLNLLKGVLETLFDPHSAFIQREHDVKCRYCDFAGICNRKFID